MTSTDNAFASGWPTPGIPGGTGPLQIRGLVFMLWRMVGYGFRLIPSPRMPGSFRDDAPGYGRVTPARERRTTTSSTVAVISAAVVLILAANPAEGLSAQRIAGTSPDQSALRGAVPESFQSGDERPSRAGSAAWGHGLQLAELKLDAGKLGDAARNAVNRWPAAQRRIRPGNGCGC